MNVLARCVLARGLTPAVTPRPSSLRLSRSPEGADRFDGDPSEVDGDGDQRRASTDDQHSKPSFKFVASF
jgi:hypothetical protein